MWYSNNQRIGDKFLETAFVESTLTQYQPRSSQTCHNDSISTTLTQYQLRSSQSCHNDSISANLTQYQPRSLFSWERGLANHTNIVEPDRRTIFTRCAQSGACGTVAIKEMETNFWKLLLWRAGFAIFGGVLIFLSLKIWEYKFGMFVKAHIRRRKDVWCRPRKKAFENDERFCKTEVSFFFELTAKLFTESVFSSYSFLSNLLQKRCCFEKKCNLQSGVLFFRDGVKHRRLGSRE